MTTLRDLRKGRNLTMKSLGAIIGVAESTISQYESGKREPDFSTLQKLADYFNVSVDYLLGRTDKKETAAPKDDGLTPLERELMDLLQHLTPDQKRLLLAQIKLLLAEQAPGADSPA